MVLLPLITSVLFVKKIENKKKMGSLIQFSNYNCLFFLLVRLSLLIGTVSFVHHKMDN